MYMYLNLFWDTTIFYETLSRLISMVEIIPFYGADIMLYQNYRTNLALRY